MGFRFSKRKKVGIFNLNISKRGIGISTGNKWVRFGITADGRKYITYKIPGTGISKTEYIKENKDENFKSQYIPSIFSKDIPKEIEIKDLKKIGKPYFDLSYGKFSLPIFATLLWLIFPPAIFLSIPLYIYPIYNHIKIKKAFNGLKGKIKGSLYMDNTIYPATIDINDRYINLSYKTLKGDIKNISFEKYLMPYISSLWNLKDILGRKLIFLHKRLNQNEHEIFTFINANPNDNKSIRENFFNKVLLSFEIDDKEVIYQTKDGLGLLKSNGEEVEMRFPHRYIFLNDVKKINKTDLEIEFKDTDGEIYKFFIDKINFKLNKTYDENLYSIKKILNKFPINKTDFLQLHLLLTDAGYDLEETIFLKIKEIEEFSNTKKEKINRLKELAEDLENNMQYKGAIEVYEYILSLDEKAGVKKKLKSVKEKLKVMEEILK